jgi:hypothetical protein
MAAAQAAVDAWVDAYNTVRPHQAIDMATPASLFRPTKRATDTDISGVTVALAAADTAPGDSQVSTAVAAAIPVSGHTEIPAAVSAITFDYRIPPSGVFAIVPNAQQIWLGPTWSGRTITVWADQRSIHLLTDGHLIKTVSSRLSPVHLQQALDRGARPGGPEPAAPALPRVNGRLALPAGHAVEIDRSVARDGVIQVANQTYHVNPGLAGRRITLRLDGHLMHAIIDDQLAGSWPCPIPTNELAQLQGARPAAGPIPQLKPNQPIRVERRVPADGVTMVARQRLRIGRTHAGKVVTIVVEDTHFRVLLGDKELALYARDPKRRTIRTTAYNHRSN